MRHYDWGSRHALAALQGRTQPSAAPEAELWFGSHPLASADVEEDGARVPLGDWLARDPERRLGRDVVGRFGPRLPFLVKLLAVERPLSLQVHPDLRLAREGFERETRAGIPIESGERSYRDPYAKTELVCALGSLTALHGFRPAGEVTHRLAALGLADSLPSLAALRRQPGAGAWRRLFGELLALAPDPRRKALAAAASTDGGERAEHWTARLVGAFPDDVCALAPLFLRLVLLEPGQGLLVPPGLPHCYLEGLALEVMVSSDNVLRAGLTSKRVDPDELLRATAFAAAAPEPWTPERVSPGESRFPVRTSEFALSVLEVRPGTDFTRQDPGGIEVIVCVRGTVRVEARPAGPGVELRAGEAACVPAGIGAYRVAGEGCAYRTRVPHPGEDERV